jgi:hypothetical protein
VKCSEPIRAHKKKSREKFAVFLFVFRGASLALALAYFTSMPAQATFFSNGSLGIGKWRIKADGSAFAIHEML